MARLFDDVRAPDERQSMRLVEESEEDLAWSDSARTQVAVQVSALVFASTWASVSLAWRPWCTVVGIVYTSATLSAQRQRRQPCPTVQAGLGAFCCVAYCLAPAARRRVLWKVSALAMYGIEAVGWHSPNADLVEYSFPRFQHQLFMSLIVATYWGMPLLYTFAEKLESDALSTTQPAGAPFTREFGADAVASRFAGALLYGGTALMMVLSAVIWYRMYRLAPDLFRVFTLVIASGSVTGVVLWITGAGEIGALSGATAASFAVMAHLALDRPKPRQSVAALTAGLYGCFAYLDTPTFAFVCVLVHVAAKLHFLGELHCLRGRPRTTARLESLTESPYAALCLPTIA